MRVLPTAGFTRFLAELRPAVDAGEELIQWNA